MAETGARIWSNSENSLFNVAKIDEPVYMGGVAVSSIHWGSGNPKVEYVNAKVVLASLLPADLLFSLNNGDTLEILRREYGRVDEYDSRLLMAQFSMCMVTERWIEEIVPAFYDWEKEIAVYVQLEANFRMFQ